MKLDGKNITYLLDKMFMKIAKTYPCLYVGFLG